MDYNKNYYGEDRRVGEQCFFNGKDVYMDFNADLKSFHFQPGKLNMDFAGATGKSDFSLYHSEAEPAELTLECYIGGPSFEATQTNISNLLLEAKECIIRKEGDVFEYASVLINRQVECTEVDPYHLITLTFAAIRRKPLVLINLNETSVIYNEGNTVTGVQISFTAPRDLDSFTIMGITLDSIKEGVFYVIDGIKGRVTANGVNYFEHTDLIDFPKIMAGKNDIQMSEGIPVTISFYPVFS